MFADKFSKMGTSLILILRAVQGIFALVVLILSAAGKAPLKLQESRQDRG